MKVKTPKLILALILAALLCAALVACDLNKPATPANKPQDFETAKFTVTYDTNGGTQLTNSKWSDVP